MAIEIERLIATLEARIDKYEKNLAKANRTTDKTFTAIENRGAAMQKKLSATFSSFGKGFLVGAAGAIGIGTLTELPGAIRKIVADAAGLVDVANKVGLTTTALQELHFAATQGGASIEDFDKALGFFAKGIGAALEGTGDLGKVLEQNGIALRDQNGKVRPGIDLIKAYADVMQNAGSEQERARLATIAFGRAGADTANVFRDGSTGINAAADAITKLGGVIDDKTLQQIADLDDRWDAFTTRLETKGVRAVLNFVRAMDNLQNGKGDLGTRIRDVLAAIDKPFSDQPLKYDAAAASAAADIAKTTAQLSDALAPFYAARFDDGEWGRIAKEVISLVDAFGESGMAVDDFDAKLDALAKAQPDFRPRIEQIKSYMREILALNNAMRGVTAGGPAVAATHPLADTADRAKAAREAEGVAGLDQASKEARMTEGEKRLEAEMERLRKAIEKDHPDSIVSDAQIKDRARKNLAASDANAAQERSGSAAAGLIKQFEGFRTSAYWDRTAYRTGYGSDTVMLSDGSIEKVTAATTTTLERANADLGRRIVEFQSAIKGQIGADTFAAMDEQQQAALTSIAYNYGSLPERIVAAIKSGSDEEVHKAIRGLGSDNGGINRDRRNLEAEAYLSGASPIAQQAVRSAADMDAQQRSLAQTQEEIDLRRQLGRETLANAQAYGEFRAASQLLTAAQQDGSAVGLELHSVNELLHGDLSSLSPAARKAAEEMRELAKAAGLQEADNATINFQESIDTVQGSADTTAELGRDAIGSLISDLRAGKSAAEALSNAVDQLADKLVNMALDAAFASKSGGGGGGWLSALFGAFTGGLGAPAAGGVYAEGGYTGPGGKYQPAGTVHKGEYVFDADATRRIGPRNLEAIRRGLKGYANGGLVGPGDVTAAHRTAAAASAQGRSGPSLHFAPVTHIDATGSDVSAAEIRAIVSENNKKLYGDVRRNVSGWVASDQRRFG